MAEGREACTSDEMDCLMADIEPEPLSRDAMNGRSPGKSLHAAETKVIPESNVRCGDLTIYERSMIKKEERERKIKNLQDSLMLDYTFTPFRRTAKLNSNLSYVSSIGASSSSSGTADVSAFSRLYHTETAASRGQKYQSGTSRNVVSGWTTPMSTVSAPCRTIHSTRGSRSVSVPSSPRIEELYKCGEEKLRLLKLSDEDETKRIQERLEKEELKKSNTYTFHPQTKWNLVAERRQNARREAERAADEARRLTPKMKSADSEQHRRFREELELEECTFKPTTKWDLIDERRKNARAAQASSPKSHGDNIIISKSDQEKLERDRRFEELELKECTFAPATNWNRKTRTSRLPITKNTPINEGESFEISEPRPETPELSETSANKVKLVSSDKYQEESGRNANPPTVVRQNMVRQIVSPKTPEWKKKYKKIGQNADLESNLESAGQGLVHARKRGHAVIKSPGLEGSEGLSLSSPKKHSNVFELESVPGNFTDVVGSPALFVDDEANPSTEGTDAAGLHSEAHFPRQKMFAEQAMETRLTQNLKIQNEADERRKLEKDEIAAKEAMQHKHLPANVQVSTKPSGDAADADYETNDPYTKADDQQPKSKAKKWLDRLTKRLSKKPEEKKTTLDEDATNICLRADEKDAPALLDNQENDEAKAIERGELLRTQAEAEILSLEPEGERKPSESATVAEFLRKEAEENFREKADEGGSGGAAAEAVAERKRLCMETEEKASSEAEAKAERLSLATEAERTENENFKLEAKANEEKFRLDAEASEKKEEDNLEAVAAVDEDKPGVEAGAGEKAKEDVLGFKTEAAEKEEEGLEAEAAGQQERLKLDTEADVKEGEIPRLAMKAAKLTKEESVRLEAEAQEKRINIEVKAAKEAKEERVRLESKAETEEERLSLEAVAAEETEEESIRLDVEAAVEKERSRLETEAAVKSEEARLRLETEAVERAEEERLRLEFEIAAEEERLRLEPGAAEKTEEERIKLKAEVMEKAEVWRDESEASSEKDTIRVDAENVLREEEKRRLEEEVAEQEKEEEEVAEQEKEEKVNLDTGAETDEEKLNLEGPLVVDEGAPEERFSFEANATMKTREERLTLEAEASDREEIERLIVTEKDRLRLVVESSEKAEEERLSFEEEAAVKAGKARREAEDSGEKERLRLETKTKETGEKSLRVVAETKKKTEKERLRLEAEAAGKAEGKRLRTEIEAAAQEDRLEIEAEASKKAEEERLRLESEAETRTNSEEEPAATEIERLRLASDNLHEVSIALAQSNESEIGRKVSFESNLIATTESCDDDYGSLEVDIVSQKLFSNDGFEEIGEMNEETRKTEDDGLIEEDERQQLKSERAKKWKDRLSGKKKSKGQKQHDGQSNAATAVGENADVFPKVLYDSGDHSDSEKLPEIGSI